MQIPKSAKDGWHVYKWPEFQALMDRLGVPYNARTRAITLRVAIGEAVKIEHEFQGGDLTKPCQEVGMRHKDPSFLASKSLVAYPLIDVTNVHNERFTTSEPVICANRANKELGALDDEAPSSGSQG